MTVQIQNNSDIGMTCPACGLNITCKADWWEKAIEAMNKHKCRFINLESKDDLAS